MKIGKIMILKKIFFFILFVSFFQCIGNVGAQTVEEIKANHARIAEMEDAKSQVQAAQAEKDNAAIEVNNCTPKTCVAARNHQIEANSKFNTLQNEQIALEKKDKLEQNSNDLTQELADANCETLKTNRKNAVIEKIGGSQNDHMDGDMGTAAMRDCIKISMNSMRYLYGKHKKGIDWKIITDASDECIEYDCTKGQAKAAKKTACDNIKNKANRCDAAAYLISAYDHDWENSEQVVTKDVKGGTPPITCTGMGIATIDYESCVKFVQNGDIMDVAQGAIYTGQQLYYQDKTMTAQMNASASPNSATAGLEALHTGVKTQENLMIQRAALDTGKLATLASYYAEIPTIDDLKGKCSSYESQINSGVENVCVTVAAQQHLFGFLMNQTAKEQMKAKLVKVGIDVTSDAVMAALMAKRANDIKNAIANVKSFKPIDPLAPTMDNLQTTLCQQTPGDPKCLMGGLNKTFDAMSDNVITFGEGGTGAAFNNNPLANPSAVSSDPLAANAANNSEGMGSVVGANQQNNGLQDHASAASVSKGSAPTGGGGSGGGGGGFGGGGGGLPGPQAQGSTSAAIQGKTPNYGGGSGTLSMMGGYGINKNKGSVKDDSNPFGKLFNKDGSKSGVLNFDGRSPSSVGNKGDNIFEMISKRYTSVSADKRLIEYELTK